ncbi:MAG: hypothetical protein M1829_003458 [Trizodia sp. TS-e1964]|nr:MAG: hypothetical protein M1829_003458 [Trizodia sp. TS-e1964]
MSSKALSSTQSSPEPEDDDSNLANVDAAPLNAEDFEIEDVPSPQPAKPAPALKKRRAARACDECRKKKIKCGGKKPCTHCTMYSYECTFDQPSIRKRYPPPQYIEGLEKRVKRTDALLQSLFPGVDLDTIIKDDNTLLGGSQPMQPIPSLSPARSSPGLKQEASETFPGDSENDSLLESMVEATGQLDLDDHGHWDFHGHSSGLSFLRGMKDQLGDILGPESTTVFQIPKSRVPLDLSPSPGEPTGLRNKPKKMTLPSREKARELVSNSLDSVCAILRFVHQPSFYDMFDRIYNKPSESYGDAEIRFLPLLYVVLGLGCMFKRTLGADRGKEDYESQCREGFKYFRTGRQMIDVADCRDLTSLQALLFMVLFLSSSANIGTSYSYIGMALRSAIRMGLHRTLPMQFNPIERETRKRVFWAIRTLDTFVGAILGFPNTLNDDDIDQELPMEVNDEHLLADKALPMLAAQLPSMAGSNALTRLTFILAKVLKHVYPLKGPGHGTPGKSRQTYQVSHAKIKEIERDLQQWMESLPPELRPGGDASSHNERAQQLLRMNYAHVQMMLYRPFLHYVSQPSVARPVDQRPYACGAACISVSRNIIHITAEMRKRGLLVGSYWFITYTTFFAIISLVFCILEAPQSSIIQEILRDAHEGREVLAGMAKASLAAERCTVLLGPLFAKLPERLKLNRSYPNKSTNARKPPRVAGSCNSSPNIQQVALANQIPELHPRASTLPINTNIPSLKYTNASRYGSLSHQPSISNTKLNVISNSPIIRRSSYETFAETESPLSVRSTPSSAHSQPQSRPSPHPGSQHQHLGSSLLPEVNAMMFPSGDPFDYPLQPMSIIESGKFPNRIASSERMNTSHNQQSIINQGEDHHNLFDLNRGMVDTNTIGDIGSRNLFAVDAGLRTSRNDPTDIDQLFGQFPPYMMQGQQPGTEMDVDIGMGVGMEMEMGIGISIPEQMDSRMMEPSGQGGLGDLFAPQHIPSHAQQRSQQHSPSYSSQYVHPNALPGRAFSSHESMGSSLAPPGETHIHEASMNLDQAYNNDQWEEGLGHNSTMDPGNNSPFTQR